ncbi:hypothetical protein DXG01_013394 [Tephrocybe rancida]|nr:hypothetical protein DXG01_013394 [Tephrocybe rancida]
MATTLSPSPSSSLSSGSAGSTRSRLSFLTVSSSSTFSDVSMSSSLPSPPGSGAKTHAFFASPFPTRPPSPLLQSKPQHDEEERERREGGIKTSSFFSIPAIAIDESTPTVTTPTFELKRNFGPEGEPTPRPRDLEPDLRKLAAFPPTPPAHPNFSSHYRAPSPTTPTPVYAPPPSLASDADEPSAGHIISSSHSQPSHASTSPLPFRSPSPSPGTPTPNTSSSSSSSTTTLRLLKPLGHGAFSSVWLADDLSPVPLVLRSRRSLRDLRRQASLKSPFLKSPNSKSAGGVVRAGSLGSLRRLRARVPGTRPIRSMDVGNGEGEREREVLSSSLSRASSTSSNASSTANRQLTISIAEPEEPSSLGTPSSGFGIGSGGGGRSGGLSRSPSAKSRLVAVKMTVRGGGEGEADEEERERTRVAFVREVEVLRHISHPNITPLLAHLSTPSHHVLVLPFLPGGDLLALVNSDAAWSRLRESVLQRVWVELCSAVGWMHGVGLVHRDIKLENILLTTTLLTSPVPPDAPAPTLEDLPPPPAPLVKLTDFGLSRFVDIRSEAERVRDRAARRAARVDEFGVRMNNGGETEEEEEEEEEEDGPLLSTRCGSEAYAAPELVMGGGGAPPAAAPSPLPPAPAPTTTTTTTTGAPALTRRKATKSKKPGVYDARETDAWACGVVLYALVGRRLPFGEGVAAPGVGGITRDGEGQGQGQGGGEGRRGGRMARRAWLMRIARGEYEWPEAGASSAPHDQAPGEGSRAREEDLDMELVGPTLALSTGARRVVERLLVRDPRRRARIGELWGDTWMGGDGVFSASLAVEGRSPDGRASPSWRWEDLDDGYGEGGGGEEGQGEEGEGMEEGEMGEEEMERALEAAEREVDVGGWLVDSEGIGEIARREVV